MDLTYSNACIEMVKRFEGLRLRAYKCSSEEDYYTIGYGHYGINNPNMIIDENVAYTMLCEDLDKAAEKVNYIRKLYDYTFTQYEFDALVSFAFNLGGISQLTQDGTRNKYEIANAMLLYNTDGKNVLPGLVARREAEHNLFVNGVYPFDITNDQESDPVISDNDDILSYDDTIGKLVDDIISGKYGNGEERKNNLYDAIQDLVNKKLS